jgi:hypothetical protein
LKRHFGSIL